MKGVTPLKKETKDIHTEKTLKTVKKNKKIIQKTNFLETNKPIDKTTPTQYKISFGEINKELKKGKVKIDRKIDLHGYSLSKAYEILKKEIKNTYEKNKRCILVVTGKGLKTTDGKAPAEFIITSDMKSWHWAKAKITSKNTVQVWSDQVTNPVAVRYAWANNPVNPNLTNSAKIPASPFRTDDERK